MRLFNETKEALEQQTATSRVLEVISRSAFDLERVLDTVAENAARLCGASRGVVWRFDSEAPQIAAMWSAHEVSDELRVAFARLPEHPDFARSVVGRAAESRRPVQTEDAFADPTYPTFRIEGASHTRLGVPLLRDDRLIGVLLVARDDVRPFTPHEIQLVRTFADQAVIAIENVRLFNETREGLERQTAISGILSVISSSPTDVQPVLEAIAESARRFCVAEDAIVCIAENGLAIIRAHTGPVPPPAPFVIDRTAVVTRSMVDRTTIHVTDVQAEGAEYPVGSAQAKVVGAHTMVATPLMREGEAIGAILLRRAEVRPFTDKQVELLRTFADQAAIAIENIRLLNETTEGLERQTAMSGILSVISSSPTDVQPVLDAITESAARFCAAEDASVGLLEGNFWRIRAHHGPVEMTAPMGAPIGPTYVSGRSIIERRTIHVPDLQAEADQYPAGLAASPTTHAIVATPLLSTAGPIGALFLRRTAATPFTERQIELAETFAAQAVIAIENVRLFNETKEALERQTATSEVLKVISRSAFDLQRVLDAVIESATKLTSGTGGAIWQLEGEEYHFVAAANPSDAMVEAIRRGATVRLEDGHDSVLGRAGRSRLPVQVEDVQADPGYPASPSLPKARTRLGVPLLREGVPIGVLVMWRTEVRRFTEKEIELAVSFADQAVIAIENTRLLNEIQDKSQQLEAASRHKSEFLANMSHELRTPLNAIIGFSDVLEQRMFGELNERQADYLRDIAGSGRHLLELVNEILDLSKVEAGRMELEPSEFALAETIRAALAFVRERAAGHGIELTAQLPADLGSMGADERKIRQVLLNLLSNAVKFTPDGGRVAVHAWRTEDEIQVSVQDTGIGIAPENQPRVFEEFRQVGKPSDRSREGTGLGLTLAKRFIELHGGRIWIDSAVGKGTTFTFALPLGRTAIPN